MHDNACAYRPLVALYASQMELYRCVQRIFLIVPLFLFIAQMTFVPIYNNVQMDCCVFYVKGTLKISLKKIIKKS